MSKIKLETGWVNLNDSRDMQLAIYKLNDAVEYLAYELDKERRRNKKLRRKLKRLGV